MAAVTFGTAELVDGHWLLDVEPHVAIRAKRLFGKASKAHGKIAISATEENSRDLEWLMTRYPLLVSHEEVLESSARAFDRRALDTKRILSGERSVAPAKLEYPARDYQQRAAAVAHLNGALLLADELGLGKTISAIALFSLESTLPALVVVPAHLTVQWKLEIERFLPFLYVHITKKSEAYSMDHQGREPDVVVTTYSKLRGWADHLAGAVRTVVFDEVQDLRSGYATGIRPQKYSAAELVAEKASYRIGLSATPIYNYGDEFFSVLNVLKPGSLGTRAEFLREWCTSYGAKWKITDPAAFGTYLREAGLMVRRTRKDVGRELPDLTRVVHEVASDKGSLEKIRGRAGELARLILSEAKGWEQMEARSEFSMVMRQATGLAKAPYVAEFVRMMLSDGDPLVLFGWHRAVYDIWAQQLREFEPAWYTGHESPSKKEKEKQRFLSGDTPLLVLSLRSGSGLDGLQGICSRVVVGELDWSPGVIEQCIGRVYRDGQVDPVIAYYLVSRDGSDPVMTDVLGLKRSQIDGVREPYGGLTSAKEADPNHVRRLAESFLKRGT